MRDALVRRGVAVAETDGFQSYDLRDRRSADDSSADKRAAHRRQHRTALANSSRSATRADRRGDVMFVFLAAGFSLDATIVGIAVRSLLPWGYWRSPARDAFPRSSTPARLK